MEIQEKEYVKQFWDEIVQEGDNLRKQEMPVLREEDFFLFRDTGNRLVYENAYFGRRRYLMVFGILSEFGKRREDIKQLGRVISSVCRERFWALPAHVDFAKLDQKTIDLFAAETAQTLSELLVILGEQLPRDVVEEAQQEILDRVIAPFYSKGFPYSWWETDRCNWSAVCAGSIGMAVIYMDRMGKLPAGWRKPCIDRVCAALQCYLDGMEADGACTEGLGYFSYGMSYYTAFAELLSKETDGAVNLMARPNCGNIAAFQQKCYFGKGVSLSFSDASCHERFLPGLTAYLAHCFPEVEVPDYAAARRLKEDACCRWLENERNIRWLMQYGNKKKQYVAKEGLNWNLLPAAQWLICKDQFGNGFAAKGGCNDENHNHNDVGEFLCVYQGEMILADLGAGEYTKDYFSDARYTILCNRSMGHSVPFVNGREQCAGAQYRADAFTWNAQEQALTVSFAQAYPQGIIDSITREIRMSSAIETRKAAGMQMTVLDTFKPSLQTQTVTENLMTVFQPVIQKDGIVEIKGQNSTCRIVIWQKLNAAGQEHEDIWKQVEQIQAIPMEHSCHDGSKITVYLMQWNLNIAHGQITQCNMQMEWSYCGSIFQ